MKSPITNTLLMVEPVAFGFNPETAVNNYFQQQDKMSSSEIQRLALAEFSAMVKQLQDKGIHVIVVKDTSEPHTPDSIFPNNWISFMKRKDCYLPDVCRKPPERAPKGNYSVYR